MSPSGDESLHTRLQAAARQRTVLDVGAQRVGRVYAEALLNAADKHDAAAEILEEFDAVVDDVFSREPDLEAFLASNAIGRDRKKEVIEKAFQGRADDVFVNFLLVLNEHERLDMLRAIHAAYGDLYDQRSGRLRVNVTSAVPLADDQAETLRHEIRAK